LQRGDLIDIISMNPSGLWRGHCDSRVGHFKFITVELLPDRPSRDRKKEMRQKSFSERLEYTRFKKRSTFDLLTRPKKRPTFLVYHHTIYTYFAKKLEYRSISRLCKAYTFVIARLWPDENFSVFSNVLGHNIHSHTNMTIIWKYSSINCPFFPVGYQLFLNFSRGEDDQRSINEILKMKTKPETVEDLLKLIGLEVTKIFSSIFTNRLEYIDSFWSLLT